MPDTLFDAILYDNRTVSHRDTNPPPTVSHRDTKALQRYPYGKHYLDIYKGIYPHRPDGGGRPPARDRRRLRPASRRRPTALICCRRCVATALTPEMRMPDPSPHPCHEPIVASRRSAFLELCPMVAVVDVIQPTKVAHRNAIAGALGLAECDHRGSCGEGAMRR